MVTMMVMMMMMCVADHLHRRQAAVVFQVCEADEEGS
jgi:hypothetical protein